MSRVYAKATLLTTNISIDCEQRLGEPSQPPSLSTVCWLWDKEEVSGTNLLRGEHVKCMSEWFGFTHAAWEGVARLPPSQNQNAPAAPPLHAEPCAGCGLQAAHA